MVPTIRRPLLVASRLSLGIAALLAGLVGAGPANAFAQDGSAAAFDSAGPFVGNRNSKVFHKTTCGVLGRTSPSSKIEIPGARVALANGFRPCRTCNPLAEAEESTEAGIALTSGPAAPGQNPGPEETGTLKFSRDIAPILVGNCIGCHNADDKARRNNLDLTTFQTLMAGGDGGPAIVASNPAEGLLLRRVRGLDGARMPPGDRELAPETIERIERWVREGARLDDGLMPEALLTSYTPSPEALRQAELADLTPEEADERVREAGLERWSKATSSEAQVATSGRVMLFAEIPEDRSDDLRKQLNEQINALAQLLGPPAQARLGGPAKLSVFLFDERLAFTEFVRSVEGREIEAGDIACANLGDVLPFIAAVWETSEGTPKAARPERSLIGVLTEQLAAETVQRSGNPPRWLSLGLGASLAQRIEPRSPYYARLRASCLDLVRRGGIVRAQELIGGQGEVNNIRALGFGLLDWIGAAYRPTLTPFIRAMLADGSKFDDVIKQGYGADRDEFLNAWGAWVVQSYARRR